MAYWTEEDDEKLRELTSQGLTCSQISERMPGRSKNSVISRRHRIGLSEGDVLRKPKPVLSENAEEILRLRCDCQWPESSITQALRPDSHSTEHYHKYVERVIEAYSKEAP